MAVLTRFVQFNGKSKACDRIDTRVLYPFHYYANKNDTSAAYVCGIKLHKFSGYKLGFKQLIKSSTNVQGVQSSLQIVDMYILSCLDEYWDVTCSLRKRGWAEEAGDGRGAEEREGVGSNEAAWGFVLCDGSAAQHEAVHEAREGAALHDTELQRPDGPHLP